MTQEVCAICLENLYDNSYLFSLENCNHLYHYNCINNYVNINKYESIINCPLCRTEFKTIGFNKLDVNLILNRHLIEENNILNMLPYECFVYENLPISNKLSEFLKIPHNCLSNRYIITKQIYKYIKNNNLENKDKTINLDEKLKFLFENEIDKNLNLNKCIYKDIHIYLCNHIGYFTQESVL